MKKLFMLIALALPLALASCDNDKNKDNPDVPLSAADIIGTWAPDKVDVEIVTGIPAMNELLKNNMLEVMDMGEMPLFRFMEDGIMESVYGDENDTDENSYSISDNILAMSIDGRIISMNVSMPDKNTLVMTYDGLAMMNEEELEEIIELVGSISKCNVILTYKKVG